MHHYLKIDRCIKRNGSMILQIEMRQKWRPRPVTVKKKGLGHARLVNTCSHVSELNKFRVQLLHINIDIEWLWHIKRPIAPRFVLGPGSNKYKNPITDADYIGFKYICLTLHEWLVRRARVIYPESSDLNLPSFTIWPPFLLQLSSPP